MKKITQLRLCDWSLLALTIAILISALQLEITNSWGVLPVWVHIIVGCLFIGAVACHIYMHFGRNNWFIRFRKQKSPATRILWWLFLATLLSGIVAMAHWIPTAQHSPVGGIHGKIGFLMLIISIGHISRRLKFLIPISPISRRT